MRRTVCGLSSGLLLLKNFVTLFLKRALLQGPPPGGRFSRISEPSLEKNAFARAGRFTNPPLTVP